MRLEPHVRVLHSGRTWVDLDDVGEPTGRLGATAGQGCPRVPGDGKPWLVFVDRANARRPAGQEPARSPLETGQVEGAPVAALDPAAVGHGPRGDVEPVID